MQTTKSRTVLCDGCPSKLSILVEHTWLLPYCEPKLATCRDHTRCPAQELTDLGFLGQIRSNKIQKEQTGGRVGAAVI